MTGGHEMWRDKSLHKFTQSGRIRNFAAKGGRSTSRGEAISNWIGNLMGSGRGDLTVSQGKLGTLKS